MVRNVANGVTGGIGSIRYSENNVTKNIPVAYVVENGITRLVFEEDSGTVAQYGTTLNLATARSNSVAENAGDNYLLIAGGRDASGNHLKTVETINSSLTIGTAANTDFVLESANDMLKHTRTSTHALFFGSSSSAEAVNVYDSSLTKTTPFNFYNSNYMISGAHLNGKAYVLWDYMCNVLDDAMTLTASESTTLTIVASNAEVVSMSDHILVSSYYNSNGVVSNVVSIDDSLTMTDVGSLTLARYYITGAYNGSHALFAGGYSLEGSAVYYSAVDAFDNSLTKVSASDLSAARYSIGATRLGNYAIFAGGYSRSSTAHLSHSEVDMYDKALTKQSVAALPEKKHVPASGTVGNHAVFAGGYTTSFVTTKTITIYDLQK